MNLSVSSSQKSPSNPIKIPKGQQDNKDNFPVDHVAEYYFSLKHQLKYGPPNVQLDEGTLFFEVRSFEGDLSREAHVEKPLVPND